MQNDAARNAGIEPQFHISPYKYPCRGAIALSFDFETSATYGDFSTLSTKIRSSLSSLAAKLTKRRSDLSFHYGMGYAMRVGAMNIIEVLKRSNIHATWFATGHVLLDNNRKRNAYRISQKLPYATLAAGFTDITTWRRDFPTFYHEPFGDCRSDPFWYFGDISRMLKELGEDIQCHTFSHPYVALELAENIRTDIEDWQAAALANGFSRAFIFSFPFGGDVYRHYAGLSLDAMISKRIPGAPYTVVPLSRMVTDILHENGIELLTRCGSKYGACGGFEPYEDSSLFFMSDHEFIPEREDIGSIDAVINKVASAGAAVNLWMHPCDVFSESQTQKFQDLVARLTAAAESGKTCISNIADIWNRYKEVQKCRLVITRADLEYLGIALTNENPVRIENLLLASSLPVLAIIGQNNNIEVCGAGFVIKEIGPRETVQFRCKLAGKP